MDKLPDHIIVRIGTYLGLKDLQNYLLVNTKINSLSSDQKFWRTRVYYEFDYQVKTKPTWEMTYRHLHSKYNSEDLSVCGFWSQHVGLTPHQLKYIHAKGERDVKWNNSFQVWEFLVKLVTHCKLPIEIQTNWDDWKSWTPVDFSNQTESIVGQFHKQEFDLNTTIEIIAYMKRTLPEKFAEMSSMGLFQ